MIKRIGFFIVFSFFLVALSINFLHHNALAAVSNQTNSTSTATFTIQGGNGNDVFDAKGNKILKPNQVRGINLIKLDPSLSGRTAELPTGTIIFLHFPNGVDNITVNPNIGIVEKAGGTYNLPKEDVAVLKVVGQGLATISVTYKTVTKNSANTSTAWSGYYRPTGGSYTDITSKWTVPTASSCSSGETHSSTWVGIDDGTDANSDLIQTGTESNCLSNSPSYRAWWEILPAGEQTLDPTTYPVAAGDQMSAEVKQNSGTSWTITINNITQSWASPFTTTQTYSGPQSTSEWVVERPLVSGSRATLTNYGTATFTNGTLNGANPNLSYLNDSLDMVVSGSDISTVSNPNGTTDGFTAYYCGSSTGCSTAWSNNSPSGTTHDTITAINASSASNAWAAGNESVGCGTQEPVTYQSNGLGWTRYLIPYNCASYPYSLNGIVTSSSSNAWAVGSYYPTGQQTLAYHWTCSSNCTGSSWSQVTSANPDGTSSTKRNQLLAITLDSSGTPWVAGSYGGNGDYQTQLVEKWDGTSQFTQQTLPTLQLPIPVSVLNSISFSSSSHGWAVGQAQWWVSGWQYGYLIENYNSGTWSATIGATSSGNLKSVAAVSDSEAWAVGSHGTSPYAPLIMHTTNGGSTWTEDTSFNGSYPSGTNLLSVSVDSSSDVWIVGYSGTSTSPYSMHYNGSAWTQVSTPSVSGNTKLYGVSVNSGVAWAGGGNIPSGQSYTLPVTFKSL